MAIRAIIIDDEFSAIAVLKNLIREFISDIEIIDTANSVEEGISKIRSARPDIVFLDIKIGKQTGFELLDQCQDLNFEVIFTTAYGEYREKAFEAFALNYLTKPIDVGKLEKTIQRFRQRNQNTYKKEVLNELKSFSDTAFSSGKIALSVKNGHVIVAVSDIIRCEADSNYTKVFLVDSRTFMVAKTLKYVEELLNKANFFRVHKSHLINTDYILEVKTDGTLLLQNNHQVVISQRSKAEFFNHLQKRR
jgi:two-component system LytT family response regulator